MGVVATGGKFAAEKMQLGDLTPGYANIILRIVAERGSDAMELLRGAHTIAIQTMIAILNDPQVPARVRLMAADSIIDRVAGKATQRIEAVGVAPSSDPVAEHDRLLREVQQLTRETGLELLPHSSSNGQSSTPRAEETIQEDKGQAPIPGRIVPALRDDGGGESFRTYYE